MKKYIVFIIFCFVLLASGILACNKAINSNTTSKLSASDCQYRTVSSDASQSSATNDAVLICDELLEVFSNIHKNVELHENGTELTAVTPTVILLNWCSHTTACDVCVSNTTTTYLASLSDTDKETFLNQMITIDATYQALLGEDDSAVLEEAGITDTISPNETFETIMTALGIR